MSGEAAVVAETTGSESIGGESTSSQSESSSTESSAQESTIQTSSTGISRPAWMDKGDSETGEEGKEEDEESGTQETETGDKASGGKESASPGSSAEGQETGQEETGKETGEEAGQEDGEKSKEIENNMNVALRESRAETKFFKGKLSEAEGTIADLKQQLAAKPQAQEQPGEWDNFQVLSEDELDELAEDDPIAAAKYAKDLVKYERHQRDQQEAAEKRQQQETEWGVQSEIARSRIKEALPDDKAHDALATTLSEHGFTEDLYALTDPSTKIITSDGEQVPLNHLAARLVESLVSLTGAAGKAPEITLENVPANVRAEIIAQEQEAILNKAKGKARSTGNSISKIPSSHSQETGKSRFEGLTYADLKTDEDRAAYLRGE